MFGIYESLLLVFAGLFLCTGSMTGSQPEQHAENGDVRLANGGTEFEGRVEIFYRHQWGTICDDSWSLEDADVVCEQLGYGPAYSAREGAYYGKGFGNITLDEIICSGLENRLDECTHGGWFVHNCDHSEDAGVWCEKPSEPIINLDISSGIIVGGVLHAVVCFVLIVACMRYCFVSRFCSKRRRCSSSNTLQSAFSVDGQLENNDLTRSDRDHILSTHSRNSTSPSIFSSRNNIASITFSSFCNRRTQSDDYSLSMVTEYADREQQQLIELPPTYNSGVGTLVIRVT